MKILAVSGSLRAASINSAHKPVALLNASLRAVHAQAALKETLTVMSALIVEESSVTVPVLGSGLDEEGIVAHPDISHKLIKSLRTLDAAVLRYKTQ